MDNGLKIYSENNKKPWVELFYKIVWKQLCFIAGSRVLDFGSGFGIGKSFGKEKRSGGNRAKCRHGYDADKGKQLVKWHVGKNFSIDTVFAQFAHIDAILSTGCNVIEMETAAAFRAAKTVSIRTAAVLSVSDNTIINKSLISGRTDEEMNYRRFVRKNCFLKLF